jgi:hypothetical protein
MSKSNQAKKILADVALDNAFYFHTDVGVYTDEYALNLESFYHLLNNINIKSIEFHTKNTDFEKWLRFIGEKTSALQIAKLRKKELEGEVLRKKIQGILLNRINKLRVSI